MAQTPPTFKPETLPALKPQLLSRKRILRLATAWPAVQTTPQEAVHPGRPLVRKVGVPCQSVPHALVPANEPA